MMKPFDPASLKGLDTPQIIGAVIIIALIVGFLWARHVIVNGKDKFVAEQEAEARNSENAIAILQQQLAREIDEMRRERDEWRDERQKQQRVIADLQRRLSELEQEKAVEKMAHREEIHRVKNQNQTLFWCVEILLDIVRGSDMTDKTKQQLEWVERNIHEVRESSRTPDSPRSP